MNSYLKAEGVLLLPEGSIVEKSYWDFLESSEVSALCGVPYTYEILKKFRILDRPFRNLKLITQAGGALDRQTKEFFLRKVQERAVERAVSNIMVAAHIASKDYQIVVVDKIPRKDSGKTDYIALQKILCG